MGKIVSTIKREIGRRDPMADETERRYVPTVEIIALTKRTFGRQEIEAKIQRDFTPYPEADPMELGFGVEMACRELVAGALYRR